MRCSVKNCTNDSKKSAKLSNKVTFHLFPKDISLRQVWVDAVGIEYGMLNERSVVCSEHFLDEDLYETKTGLRKIKVGAVPNVSLNIEENSDQPAMMRVCRICLTTNTKMYDLSASKLDQTFEDVIGIQVSSDDKLPQKLCWECSHRLRSCDQFRRKARRCHDVLNTLLMSSDLLTIGDIKSVNRIEHNLQSSLKQIKIVEQGDSQASEETSTVKEELTIEPIAENYIDDTVDNDSIEFDHKDGLLTPVAVDVEVKNEKKNEIFLNEYVDNSDTEDDKALSEVCKPKKKKKPVKRKVQVKKVNKSDKTVKKKDEAAKEDPNTTVDKYKVLDVKRRKTNDFLDESLFTITTLTYEEQIAEVQKRAESTLYINAAYKCDICFRGFHIKDRYDVHAFRHTDQCGAYECFICKTRLKTARALRKHLTAQHTEKYSCKGCPFVTRNRGVAREHEKWHAGTRYQCPHCPSEFDKLTTYMGHIRIKHVSDCVCELCGFTFVSKKGIDVHKKKKHRLETTDTLDGPYCEVCDVKFISEEAHSRHLKLSSRHSSDNDPNRVRNDSQSAHAQRNGRAAPDRRHATSATHHAATHGPITCEQCGVQLRDLRLYAQHFRRAHPDKNRTKYPAMKTPAMCEQCGRIFQSMALLKDHMWVHTGVKRFKCSSCDKSFTQKTNLVFHQRAHLATRPTYECPLCGKHFAFYNNRRRHMFIHTGLKPFKCETCGKCFTTAGEQRAHVDHVHLKKPWPRRVRAREPWKCATSED